MDQLDKEFFMLTQSAYIEDIVLDTPTNIQLAMGAVASLANFLVLMERYPELMTDEVAMGLYSALSSVAELIDKDDVEQARNIFQKIASFSGSLPNT